MRELDHLDRSQSIGVITHRDLLEEVIAVAKSMDFESVQGLYFHNLRSSRALEQCEVLLVVGRPMPNPAGFDQIASAFFWDENRLEHEWGLDKAELLLGSGTVVPLAVQRPTGDERASRFHYQLCEAEMVQAIHRSRPVRVAEEARKTIIILTDRPLPGIRIDRFIGRWGRVIETIRSLVAEGQDVSPADVARAMPQEWPSQDERTLANSGSSWILGRGTKEEGTRPVTLAALAEVDWSDGVFRSCTE